MARAAARSCAEGDTAATIATWPLRARWVAVSASRRMFSLRSCAEKPKSRLRPARKVSPSSRIGEPPWLNSLPSADYQVPIGSLMAVLRRTAKSFQPARPYLRVEYWRHGMKLDRADGEALARRALEAEIGQMSPKRIVFPRFR